MGRTKITTRDILIKFSIFILSLSLIWTYAYISSQKDKKLVEESRLHMENLFENVKFEGEILHVKNAGSRYRGVNIVCIKLETLDIDSMNILKNNQYFNFDWKLTVLTLPYVDPKTKVRLLEMDKVRLDKNGRLMLYSANSDSLDITTKLLDLRNSENTRLCRDFIQ